MLTLIQFPWSPFCITIRHILTRHRIPFRLHNIAYHDRAPIINSDEGPGPHGALPDRREARDLRRHGFWPGGRALRGSALSASPLSQKPRWDAADSLTLYRERSRVGGIQGERYVRDSDSPSHRADDAHSPQGTEVRKRMRPGMDHPPTVSVRSVCGTLEADRRHAGGFAVSADRSPIVRGLQSVRRARQLPVQRQDTIAQSETPPTLAPGDEYEAVTFAAPFAVITQHALAPSSAIRKREQLVAMAVKRDKGYTALLPSLPGYCRLLFLRRL